MAASRLFRRRPPGRHAAGHDEPPAATRTHAAIAYPPAEVVAAPAAAPATMPAATTPAAPATMPAATTPAAPPISPVTRAVPQPFAVAEAFRPAVRLGFADGTSVDLDDGCLASQALREVADVLRAGHRPT